MNLKIEKPTSSTSWISKKNFDGGLIDFIMHVQFFSLVICCYRGKRLGSNEINLFEFMILSNLKFRCIIMQPHYNMRMLWLSSDKPRLNHYQDIMWVYYNVLVLWPRWIKKWFDHFVIPHILAHVHDSIENIIWSKKDREVKRCFKL